MWPVYRYEAVFERLLLPLMAGGAGVGAVQGGLALVRSQEVPSLASTAIVMTLGALIGGTAGMVCAIMHPLAPMIVAVHGYHRYTPRLGP